MQELLLSQWRSVRRERHLTPERKDAMPRKMQVQTPGTFVLRKPTRRSPLRRSKSITFRQFLSDACIYNEDGTPADFVAISGRMSQVRTGGFKCEYPLKIYTP